MFSMQGGNSLFNKPIDHKTEITLLKIKIELTLEYLSKALDREQFLALPEPKPEQSKTTTQLLTPSYFAKLQHDYLILNAYYEKLLRIRIQHLRQRVYDLLHHEKSELGEKEFKELNLQLDDPLSESNSTSSLVSLEWQMHNLSNGVAVMEQALKRKEDDDSLYLVKLDRSEEVKPTAIPLLSSSWTTLFSSEEIVVSLSDNIPSTIVNIQSMRQTS